ncbi:MAG: hypothetical protein R2774_07750 [Saprospiraceae bacterium]
MELSNLLSKVNKYTSVLSNTITYRKLWVDEVKPLIVSTLEEIITSIQLPKVKIDIRSEVENLEAIVLDLGNTSSGLSQNYENTDVKRIMIKSNGSLIYQQLFNGKIMVMIVNPHIEGYGEQKPPVIIEILRPDELNVPFIIRHMENFIKAITEWEDYDDDEPQKNVIGFNPIAVPRPEIGEES